MSIIRRRRISAMRFWRASRRARCRRDAPAGGRRTARAATSSDREHQREDVHEAVEGRRRTAVARRRALRRRGCCMRCRRPRVATSPALRARRVAVAAAVRVAGVVAVSVRALPSSAGRPSAAGRPSNACPAHVGGRDADGRERRRRSRARSRGRRSTGRAGSRPSRCRPRCRGRPRCSVRPSRRRGGDQRAVGRLGEAGLQPDRARVGREEALVVVREMPRDAGRVGEVVVDALRAVSRSPGTASALRATTARSYALMRRAAPTPSASSSPAGSLKVVSLRAEPLRRPRWRPWRTARPIRSCAPRSRRRRRWPRP